MKPFLTTSDDEISACFPVFKELRSHLDPEGFLKQVRRQEAQGYRILAGCVDGVVKSAAGFRLAEFLAWGKALYVDDLVTAADSRGRGHADALLSWLIGYARVNGCSSLHLDSGYGRHTAHRFYLKHGLSLACHHLSIELQSSCPTPPPK